MLENRPSAILRSLNRYGTRPNAIDLDEYAQPIDLFGFDDVP
jgi:hypothetical protein